MVGHVQSQTPVHTEQNGIKTTVTNLLGNHQQLPQRYEIARIGYNSYHWQSGGTVIVELFQYHWQPAYAKYFVHVGYTRGASYGEPELCLVEASGSPGLAKLELGDPVSLSTSYLGHPNYGLPIYVDVKRYATCRIRITYQHHAVEQLTAHNQIRLFAQPTGLEISDFPVSRVLDVALSSSRQLRVSGEGQHYISAGNVGIGTTNPQAKLAVNGNILATEVKVKTDLTVPDYVFEPDYELTSLSDLKAYVREYRHLPEIPSAKDIERDGLDLAKMDLLLLKKVEELTLHLIEKDKVIENMLQRLNQLEGVKNQ